MLLFDAPEAASPPREDPFHCGSVCVFDLLIQDSSDRGSPWTAVLLHCPLSNFRARSRPGYGFTQGLGPGRDRADAQRDHELAPGIAPCDAAGHHRPLRAPGQRGARGEGERGGGGLGLGGGGLGGGRACT